MPAGPISTRDQVPGSLHFLNARDGIYSSQTDAFVTHDGGVHWADARLHGGDLIITVTESQAWAVFQPCPSGQSCASPVMYEARRSTDAGASWSKPQALYGLAGGGLPEAVAFGGSGLLVADRSSMEITTDGGTTWKSHWLPCTQSTASGIDIGTFDGREIWKSCTPSEFFISQDAGASWSSAAGPWSVAESTSLNYGFLATLIALGKGTALVALWGGYLFLTSDGGATWAQVGPGPAELGRCGFIYARYFERAGLWSDTCTTLPSQSGQVIWRSQDEGRTWSHLPPILLGSA
ncbi:MAG TPA: YCF48-related protein [Candidatus Udaeobacter sp.]|nr:YCF48-related protein [Candidatus Udaeobacter sp.]